MNQAGFKRHNQYNQVQIKTANKGILLIKLYQGAIRFMKRALIMMEKKDMEGKGNALIRAQDIVLELVCSLDQELLDQGDELADNLKRLYLYSYKRLVHANIHLDADAVDEVIKLMENLLQAWEQVVDEDSRTEQAPSSGVAITG